MKQNANQFIFPVTLVVAIMAFLSIIIFAEVNSSFAAASKKKSSDVGRASAVEFTEARIKQLQGALKITDAQKELWNDLTQVMLENAKEMDALTKDRTEKTMTMNSVEQMKFRVQISQAHLDQLKKFIPPFDALYDSMSDKQKKATDTIFLTGRDGKKSMH